MSPSRHYFSSAPAAPSRPRTIEFRDGGRAYRFRTHAGVFSRTGVDRGTRLLLETVAVGDAGRVLDLGCGYGVLGIVVAGRAPGTRVILVDVNPGAVALAAENVALNGVTNADVRLGDGCAPVRDERFDVILFNPPIRAGRAVVLRLLREGARHLAPGGRIYLVARTQQGARTLGRLMRQMYRAVVEVARGGGFRVFEGRDV